MRIYYVSECRNPSSQVLAFELVGNPGMAIEDNFSQLRQVIDHIIIVHFAEIF